MGIKEIAFIIIFSKIVEKIIDWGIKKFKSRKEREAV